MDTISFRVDKKLKMEFDKASIRWSQSQAIKEVIHAFYQHLLMHEESQKSPQPIFKDSGFIGSFQGKKDHSVIIREIFLKLEG